MKLLSAGRLAFASAMTLAVLGLSFEAEAQRARHERGPVILFEQERAASRGDRQILRLGDDSSIIPGHRIKALPVVDGRMGDRVELDGGLQLYFPFGRIVQAQSDISKYRMNGAGKPEVDPLYQKITSFDSTLGPVCASAVDKRQPGNRLDMRLGPGKAVTLVSVTPDTSVAPDGERQRVLTALEYHYIKSEPQAAQLFAACNSAGPKPKVLAKE
ncbi:MAG: hypothetical protein KIT20_01335 [Alphaproteobacteria bacterium]|nr:hypothetical protein [Alphaproteobacteria bacterium]